MSLLHESSTKDSFLTRVNDVLSCICAPPQVLSHSYVLGYFMHQSTARRYLEHLQAQLIVLLEAIVAPLEAIPGAQALPNMEVPGPPLVKHTPSSRDKPGPDVKPRLSSPLSPAGLQGTSSWTAAPSGGGPKVKTRKGLFSWMNYSAYGGTKKEKTAVGSAAASPQPRAQATVAESLLESVGDDSVVALSGLAGSETSKQLMYCLALMRERRAALIAAVQQSERYRLALATAGRAGLFSDTRDSSIPLGSGGGGGVWDSDLTDDGPGSSIVYTVTAAAEMLVDWADVRLRPMSRALLSWMNA